MEASTLTAAPVILLDTFVSARYCTKLVRREIAPRLATWLIFEAGVLMSLAAYLRSHDHNLIKAALNATDAVLVTVILVLVLFAQKRQKLQFTKNEWLCVTLACLAAAFWFATKTEWTGLVGFQLVMSVAYVPTLENLWNWRPGPSPEPIDKWSINMLISILGMVPAMIGRKDCLAVIYPLRALVLCALVVTLILRWRLKSKDESHAL